MHSFERIAQRDENRVQPNRWRGPASRRSALSTASRSALRNTKLQTLSRLTFVVREQARSKESGPWTLRVRPPKLGPTLSLARDHDPSASCCHADCFVVPPQTIITPSSLGGRGLALRCRRVGRGCAPRVVLGFADPLLSQPSFLGLGPFAKCRQPARPTRLPPPNPRRPFRPAFGVVRTNSPTPLPNRKRLWPPRLRVSSEVRTNTLRVCAPNQPDDLTPPDPRSSDQVPCSVECVAEPPRSAWVQATTCADQKAPPRTNSRFSRFCLQRAQHVSARSDAGILRLLQKGELKNRKIAF